MVRGPNGLHGAQYIKRRGPIVASNDVVGFGAEKRDCGRETERSFKVIQVCDVIGDQLGSPSRSLIGFDFNP